MYHNNMLETCTLSADLQNKIQAMEKGVFGRLRLSIKLLVTIYKTKTSFARRSNKPSGLMKNFNGQETQTEVIWSRFMITRSRKDHLLRHNERGEKKRWEDNIKEWTRLEFADF